MRQPRPFGGGGWAYTEWAAARHAERRAMNDHHRHLSEMAKATRRPGQTIDARLRELRAEAGA